MIELQSARVESSKLFYSQTKKTARNFLIDSIEFKICFFNLNPFANYKAGDKTSVQHYVANLFSLWILNCSEQLLKQWENAACVAGKMFLMHIFQLNSKCIKNQNYISSVVFARA